MLFFSLRVYFRINNLFCNFGDAVVLHVFVDTVRQDFANRGNLVVPFFEVDQPNALRSPAHDTYVGYLHAQGDARLVDDNQVVLVGYALDGNQVSGLVGDVQGLHTLAATVGYAVVFDERTLAVSLLRNYHDGLFLGIVYADHSYYGIVVVVEGHTLYTGGITAHFTHGAFVEADSPAVTVSNDNLAVIRIIISLPGEKRLIIRSQLP